LMLGSAAVNEVTLSFVPYRLGCGIDAWSGAVAFQLMVKPGKIYCFSLTVDTCNLREVACQ
jgi:hypothetical protein